MTMKATTSTTLRRLFARISSNMSDAESELDRGSGAGLLVGLGASMLGYAGYRYSLAYAKDRPQGRPAHQRDPSTPQVPIIEHADVRRMLLRQKAIVEGSLALLATVSRYDDVAAHGATDEARERANILLDLLTPIAKTFPADKGFEAALNVQYIARNASRAETCGRALQALFDR